MERKSFALHYADPKQGVASTESRLDRSDARDVNFPDGSLVPIGAHFTKTWEVTNIGQVAWSRSSPHSHDPTGSDLPIVPGMGSDPRYVSGPDDPAVGRLRRRKSSRFLDSAVQDDGRGEGNLYFPNKYVYGLTLLIETGGFQWIQRDLP